MLYPAIALLAAIGQPQPNTPPTGYGPAHAAPVRARVDAKASIRIIHAVRVGRDYWGEEQSGSQRRLIKANADDGNAAPIQAIEFE